MASGSANVRFGMMSPGIVSNSSGSPNGMFDHRRNSGAAMAIAGNVVIESTRARMMNFPLKRRRASAYAQNDPTISARNVVNSEMIALLRRDFVKSLLLKID